MTKITARHSRSKGEEEATACIRDQRDALLFVIKLSRNINSKLGPGFHSGSHSHFDFSSILGHLVLEFRKEERGREVN